MAVFLGSIKGDRIYAAFYYKSDKDYINNDWSVKDVADSISKISEKSDNRLKKSKYKIAVIKMYDWNIGKFKTILTRAKK